MNEYEESSVGFDISGSFEIPVEWDVLASISHDCLYGSVTNYDNKEILSDNLPARITYRIWREDLGELGTVKIVKLRPGFSEIRISGVPLDSVDNSPMWLRVKSEWDKKIRDNLTSNLSDDERMIQYSEIITEREKVKNEITARQKDHQAKVITGYFNGLVQQVGIWKPNYPPPYILAIGGFASIEDAYERGEYFGDFIKGAWDAARLATAKASQDKSAKIEETLPNEIMQLEKVARNPALQKALILYIFHPEKTLAVIATETKYKNQASLATLLLDVREELKKKYGEHRQSELLPSRKLNSSWRNVKDH